MSELNALHAAAEGRSPRPAANLSRQRARATNDPAMLVGADQRTAEARRFRDVAAALISDQGGVTECSEAKLQLIRRLAGVAVLCEALEEKIAAGATLDISAYSILVGAANRIAQRLGLSRNARKIETLDDILESSAQDEEPA